MKKLMIAVAIGIFLLLIPLAVLAGDYIAGEAGTLYAQILNGNGTPANSANVTLTLWASNGSKILDTVNMTYMPGSQGMYAYNFTCPSEIGTYVADVSSTAPTGYGSSDIHVSSPISANYTYTGNFTYTGANASQIWSENTSGYTNDLTFGGLLNSILGGNMLALAIIGLASLILMVFGFLYKPASIPLLIIAGICWMVTGALVYTNYTFGSLSIPVLTIAVALAFTCFIWLFAAAMRLRRGRLSREEQDQTSYEEKVRNITRR